MVRRVICPKCEAECEYDTRSVMEGCRDFEEFLCPDCNEILDRVFTDQPPYVRIIRHGKPKKENQDL